jgi:hypothetical protein
VVDDPARQQVRLEVINPTCVKAIHKNEVGMIDYAVIEYYIHDPLFPDKANEYAKYTEVITPDYFRTYRNGEQFAYYVSPIGDPIAEWENEYGFVPLYHAMHNDVGMTWGANAYYGALQKINELNDIASIINDGARNQVRFPIAITGATSTQVSLGGSSNDTPAKDSLNVITLPADATIQALPPNINLADGLQTIQEILAELERDFPELSLHRIRDGGNLTAPGVKSAYSDAIARIQSAMVVYDTTLVEAQRGAIAIAGMRGYRGYEGFGMGVLYEDALDHNVKLRPVINDTLTQAERINLIAQVADNSANSVLLAELGLNEDEVEAIVQKSDNRMGMTYTSQLSQAPQEDLGLDPEQVGEANADSRIQDADLFSALQMMEAMDE